MNKKIDELKKSYDDIEIPEELDNKINAAIKRAKTRKKFNVTGGAVAAAILIFTIFINTNAAFAKSMSSVPVLGKLVQVLQFNKGVGYGGNVTDGADISSIESSNKNNTSKITINVSTIMNTMNKFKVEYKDYPSTMIFTMYGSRNMTAEKEFEELKKNPFVKDVYKIVTLDDSTIRFAVVFNFPVQYEIKEYKDPGKIEISLKKLKYDKSKSIYSVRTPSYEMGEGIGMVDEMFLDVEDRRILKDESGKFALELKYYDSKEEAEKALSDFKNKFGDIVKLSIEERKEGKMLKTIQE
ncbi:DUF4179 domain-containing protein [Clostridium peptidivorans]|uniref:DUF4179 domain-containing protein n=1 Tax=Clostridium peptidivorans TaxID=100174 RepID=UPI000BE4898D|nr:DUF4179 domain-containing protein [Clostridium peptidivorans]